MKIPFQPRTVEIPASDPYEKDLLNRKPIADALTNLVVSIDDTAVIAVDGAWGSGKTTFLQMWAQQLENKGCPVIMFNAWETDFSDDPLIALTSEILRGLQDCNPDLRLEELKEKAKRLISKLVVSSFFRLLRHASLGFVDLSPEQLKELGQAGVETSSDRLLLYEESKNTINEFRNTLLQTVDTLMDQETKLPLVILIDELDRCRPIYAIELLENTKHLFSVPNVIFVLGVNTAQLACSVRALYGDSFSSNEYLKRFFNQDIRLPNVSRSQLILATLQSVGVDAKYRLMPPSTPEYLHATMLSMFSRFFDLVELDYRNVDQVLRRMGLIYHSLGSKKEWERVFYVVLLILRTIDYDLYKQFCTKEVDEDAVVFRVFSRLGGEDLLQSDVGSIFTSVIIIGDWDLRGRPNKIETHSKIFARIWSRYREEAHIPSTDIELREREELFDHMNPSKSFNTISLLKSFIENERVSFRSVIELIELFLIGQTAGDKIINER